MPSEHTISYVADNFHGQLPQPYMSSTSGAPPQAMNDRNEEESSRYVPLSSCDYVVLTVMPHQGSSENYLKHYDDKQLGHMSPMQRHILDPKNGFEQVQCEKLVNTELSSSSLARAFEVPFYSALHNHFNDYCLVKVSP